MQESDSSSEESLAPKGVNFFNDIYLSFYYISSFFDILFNLFLQRYIGIISLLEEGWPVYFLHNLKIVGLIWKELHRTSITKNDQPSILKFLIVQFIPWGLYIMIWVHHCPHSLFSIFSLFFNMLRIHSWSCS